MKDVIKNVFYKKIIFDDINFSTTYDSEYKDYIDFKHGFDKRELKMLIFTHYNNKKEYVIRDEIKLEVKNIENYKKDEIVLIKTGKKTPIGKGIIYSIDKDKKIITLKELKLFIKDDDYTDDVKILFSNIEKKNIKLYTKGLFKIYYRTIENEAKYYQNPKFNKIDNHKMLSHTKITAMCNYLAVKEVFKDYGLLLSESNVFINNDRREYDALILTKNSNDYKGIYNDDEVLSTLELKTSGYQSRNDEAASTPENYKFFGDYLENGKHENIKHIYLSMHEGKHRYEVYKKIADDYKEESIFTIFCALKKGEECFILPDEYNLEEILKYKNKN